MKKPAKAAVTGAGAAGPPTLLWENQDWIASFDYVSVTLVLTISAVWMGLFLGGFALASLHRRLREAEATLARDIYPPQASK